MTTLITQFAFGDWNNYSSLVMMGLTAIWLVAAVIKLKQMTFARSNRASAMEMPSPACKEQEWNPFTKAA